MQLRASCIYFFIPLLYPSPPQNSFQVTAATTRILSVRRLMRMEVAKEIVEPALNCAAVMVRMKTDLESKVLENMSSLGSILA